MKKGSFEDRFLTKLPKIDRQEIEGFLTNLVRDKHLLQVVFNALVDGVVVLRPDLTVLFANDVAIDFLRINSRSKILGERIGTLSKIPDFTRLVSRFALDHKKMVGVEIETPQPNGKFLDISILPIEGDTPSQMGSSVVIIHDATETRKREEIRNREERMHTLGKLTMSLAHEIKNPLNSLQIHAQLMQRTLKDPEPSHTDKERLLASSEIIVDEIRRLNSVLNNFLDAVRPSRPLKATVEVGKLLQHVADTLAPETDAAGIDVRVQFDHDVAPLEVDQDQLTQAILNLVKNSMEAIKEKIEMQENDEHAEENWQPGIEIREDVVDEFLRIRIKDNGVGIPEENLHQILEPYYTTKFSGTGLGLAIVSRIVNEHGGKIDISSYPGKGTSVNIYLPLKSKPVRLLES